MANPQQFVELFLQEKTAAWAEARPHLTNVYLKYFAEPLSQHVEFFMPRETIRAEVENVQKLDYVTTVVAREHFGTRILRTRYRLAAVGESWKIIGIDRECFFCRSTGKIAGSVCQHCNGEGWHDSTNKNL